MELSTTTDEETNTNIPMLKEGLFILVSFANNLKANLNIPIDIQLLILIHIGPTIICEWQTYLFYITINNHCEQDAAETILSNIRKNILLHGCDQHNISHHEKINQQKTDNIFYRSLVERRLNTDLPLIRSVEDTIRGKVWRLLMGLKYLDSNNYQMQINKGEAHQCYIKIRGETKRTFLISDAYHSRVSESRLIRVLNSYVQQYNKSFCGGQDCIAGVLLYVMPELPAFESFCLLNNKHFPTYFYRDDTHKMDRIGAYAATFLAWDILKICDEELFHHLKPLPSLTYLFPLVASFQTICKPFTEIPKLWDFLFCFGFHLNPVMAAAHIIVNKNILLQKQPVVLLQGLLSQRRWMNGSVDTRSIINCTIKLVMILKQIQHKKLWHNILYHSSNFDIAKSIKKGHKIDIVSTNHEEKSNDLEIKHKKQSFSNVNDKKFNTNGDNKKIFKHTKDEKQNTEVVDKKDDGLNKLETNNEKDIDDISNIDNREDNNASSDSTTEESSDSSDGDNDSDTNSSGTWTSYNAEDVQENRIYTNIDAELVKRLHLTNLNEFELKDMEIEIFNVYEEQHNQLLSQYQVNVIESQNEFVAVDSIDDTLIQEWKTCVSCSI